MQTTLPSSSSAPIRNSRQARLPAWAMLPARLALFFGFQALLAAGFALAGLSTAWARSAAWWPYTATLANLVCVFLLLRLFKDEGRSYWDLFRFDRQHVKGDLLVMLGLLVILGPLSMLPGPLLGAAIYGDSAVQARLLILPLPLWAVYAILLPFPLTQGLAELAVYFKYAMPRLGEQTGRPWLAYVLASFFLGIQHIAIPVVFDWRYITWRGLMFMPFAFVVGAALKWRPRLFPYFAIVHVLIDLAAMAVYLIPA
jgi:membrane protease YdiL (CAAX protease family)